MVAGGAFYGFQPVWAVPTLFLSEPAAAASIGLINAVGILALVGPMVIGYLASRTHSFSGLLNSGESVVSGLLMSGGGGRFRWKSHKNGESVRQIRISASG